MPMIHIDATDFRILDELQRDAHLSNVRLAERVHLSASPTLARVKRLEREGVIRQYVALVDALAVGLTVSVFIQVSVERQVSEVLERFEAAVAQHPEVMEVYLMTGDADYLLRVVVPDMQAYERFVLDKLTRIPGVAQIRSSFAVKQVKYKTALPLPVPLRPARSVTSGRSDDSGRSEDSGRLEDWGRLEGSGPSASAGRSGNSGRSIQSVRPVRPATEGPARAAKKRRARAPR